MTPLETALSGLREATCSAAVAASTLPDSTASRNLRTWVRSSDLTALLRWCAFSFCLLRLICDLMFATRKGPHSLSVKVFGDRHRPRSVPRREPAEERGRVAEGSPS